MLGILIFWLALPNYQLRPQYEGPLQIVAQDEGYTLQRQAEAHYIKGAAGNGKLSQIQAMGGNTLRLYHYFATDSILDLADSLGLQVIYDLDMPRESSPFAYDQSQKTDSLVEAIKQSVRRSRHHNSIVAWNIGNEIVAPDWRKSAPWKLVGRIAQELKVLDPQRLTTTAVPLHPVPLMMARLYAPELDFLSINAFKLSLGVTSYWDYCFVCWDGPYLYSELGPQGTWQVTANEWNVHQEWNDVRKTAHLAYMYDHFLPAEPNCLGACVFFWGFKQERTHTWYSLFSEEGEKTPIVDELSRVWQGHYPPNRTPMVEQIRVKGIDERHNTTLRAGQIQEAIVKATDPEGDSLQISWEIYHEGDYRHKFNGEGENRPQALPELILGAKDSLLRFQVPKNPGDYRLYVYARDGYNNISSHNIPFFVVLDEY